MGGTLLNMLTVALGSALGLLVGHRLPARMHESVITGLGLVTFFVGISNASQTGNVLIPLFSIALGAVLGELLRIDLALHTLGGWLQARFAAAPVPDQSPASTDEAAPTLTPRERFITGFVTASLLFCVGPLTFLGSLQDGMGLSIGYQQLAIKSVLDGFTAIAFASTFGVGVAFSVVTILVLQGGLALAGSVLGEFLSTPMVNEMTATGGLILMGLALVLLDIKRPRMANFIPALVLAPLIVAAAPLLGINLYPL